MQLYDFKQVLMELKNKLGIVETKQGFLEEKISLLEQKQQEPSFWSDMNEVAVVNRELKSLQNKKNALSLAKKQISDFETGIILAEESGELFSEQELQQLLVATQETLNDLWIKTLLSGKYDAGSAIITLHSGAGGEEAQDWAEMLARMYTRYADGRGYKVTMLDVTPGEGAGIKSQTFLIDGEYAYGYLKTEKGVHRLVRLSPFDANNRRHTSFASLEVLPFVENNNTDVKISLDEIKIDTFRSSGAGGQHVNKTESAIRLTHIPTGIVVTCQNERSQIQNREMAMKILASKLTEKKLEEQEKERQAELAENKKIEWGSQIRSYVLHPYSLVKDHRTNHETGNTTAVLDGELQPFINEYLRITNNE